MVGEIFFDDFGLVGARNALILAYHVMHKLSYSWSVGLRNGAEFLVKLLRRMFS